MSARDETALVLAKERWRGTSVDERLTYLHEQMRVPCPEHRRVFDEIRRRARRCRGTGRGAILLVLCPSGGGKTYISRYLLDLSPNDHTGVVTQTRVLTFSVPAFPSATSLPKEALKKLGDPGWNTKDEEGPTGRLKDRGRRHGVEILVMDNVHDIVQKRGAQGVLECAKWIRDFKDDFPALIVLLGTPAAEAVMLKDPQLRRRGIPKLCLHYLSIETPADVARVKRFLHETDLLLPLAEICGLEEFARPLVYGSYGIQDFLLQILAEATEHAVEDGREQLTRDDLRKGFDAVYLDGGIGLNPFSGNGPRRHLDGPGEPFHEWYTYTNPRHGDTADGK